MEKLGPIAKKPINQRTSEWIQNNVVGPISETAEYYAGPHLSAALGRIGQMGDIASYYVPGVGDAKDMGETYADYVDNREKGAGWGQTAWDLGMMGLAAAPFLPMASKVDDAVDIANTARTASAVTDASKGAELGPIAKPKIKAYHGSPHKVDRFSMDKIGTGEGAQAYGHGLYFAEKKDVAKTYRDSLSEMKVGFVVDGKRYAPKTGPMTPEEEAANFVIGISGFGNPNAVRAGETKGAKQAISEAFQSVPHNKFENDPNAIRRILADWQGRKTQFRKASKGHMYEVEIDADPDMFLDWDKPLSQQSESIKEILRPKMGDSLEDQPGRDYITGQQFYRDHYGNQPEIASQNLREAGIPGIKYLDAGSRTKGDGSRNYVVFDENLVNIARKYGLLPFLGAGMYSRTQDEEQKTLGPIGGAR